MISTASFTATARSDEKPALIDVPDGRILKAKKTVRPKLELKCFDAEEWGEMAHLITDYRWLWHHTESLKLKISLLERQALALQEQAEEWRESERETRRSLRGMASLLDAEQEQRINEGKKRNLELWGWKVVTIVAVVAASAFGAAWGVERQK